MSKKVTLASVVIAACLAAFCFVCTAHLNVAWAAEGVQMEVAQADDSAATLQYATSVNGTTTGVALGAGVVGTKTFTVNQQDVRNTALKAVIKWREDALADSSIKFNGKTIQQLIDSGQVNKSEYLNPSWSNALERIAMQRAVEAGDSSLGHTRPNGEAWSTATYNDIASNAEILAWGSGYTYTGTTAVDQWAAEKADYIKECSGQSHGETGHYTTLINPQYKAYGFAITSGYDYENVAAGEAGTSLQGSADATKWKGDLSFDLSVSNTVLNNSGVSINFYAGTTTMNIGNEYALSATLGYRNNTFTIRDNWYSSDISVIKVESSGKATALKAGSAYVYVLGQNNMQVKTQVTVAENVELYRLYNQYSGEHLYSREAQERDTLVSIGWTYEGLAWRSPIESKTPVYRLYNPYSGDHHYTTEKKEYDTLGKIGWKQEGTGWYSDDAKATPVYRLYNQYVTVGTHHFTTGRDEYKELGSIGWTTEGVAWYGLK